MIKKAYSLCAMCISMVLSAGCALDSQELSAALDVASAAAGVSGTSGYMGLEEQAAVDTLKAALVTNNDVMRIASEQIAVLDRRNNVAPSHNRYARRLDRIFSSHRDENGLSLNYKVYLDDQVNAFAAPDGSIRVYSGLMDKMTDDELLFVIGHEIGHVYHEHSKEKMKVELMSSATRKMLASRDTTLGRVAASELGGLISNIVNAQFSQSEEKESDDYGLSFLKRHGYDQSAAVSALRKLADGGGGSSFLSSHPDPFDRARRIKSQINTASYSRSSASSRASAPTARNTPDSAAVRHSLNSLNSGGRLKPYIHARTYRSGSVSEHAGSVREQLENHGFEVVGEYSPNGSTHILIVSNDALKSDAAHTRRGGYGVVQRISVSNVNGYVEVAFTNPKYWYAAYRMEGDPDVVLTQLYSALGANIAFGAREGLSADKLRTYRYMFGMERFDDPTEFARYGSNESALSVIESRINSGTNNINMVYKVRVPGSDAILIGLDLSQHPKLSEASTLAKLNTHPLMFPYEILIRDGVVESLYPRFRLAVAAPDMEMVGPNSFHEIMHWPNAYVTALEGVVGR